MHFTVNLMPYIHILTVFCTHTKEADVAHGVGKPQLPACYCQQHIPDSARILLIQHFSQVLNILQSWSTHVHTQDFQMITTVVGWFSYLEETHLNWIYKKTFHRIKPVCLGKQKVYVSSAVTRHPRSTLCYLLQSLGNTSWGSTDSQNESFSLICSEICAINI